MEKLTIVGTILGFFSVVGGAWFEGLHLSAIFEPTAFLIVMGGTLASLLVSFPAQDIRRAVKDLKKVFIKNNTDLSALIDDVEAFALVARKEGALALEKMRENTKDQELKKNIKYVVDGYEPETLRSILDSEIEVAYEEDEISGKVWESAGAYAPAIGILGAVLGLIHVMQSLDNPKTIGSGIAVAFVATIYGVAFANLLFIPWGSHLKRKASISLLKREIVKLAVMGIQAGENPKFLREKLEAYVHEFAKSKKE